MYFNSTNSLHLCQHAHSFWYDINNSLLHFRRHCTFFRFLNALGIKRSVSVTIKVKRIFWVILQTFVICFHSQWLNYTISSLLSSNPLLSRRWEWRHEKFCQWLAAELLNDAANVFTFLSTQDHEKRIYRNMNALINPLLHDGHKSVRMAKISILNQEGIYNQINFLWIGRR